MSDHDPPAAGTDLSLWYRLYNGLTTYDFVGGLRKWLVISGVVIGAGLISLAWRGLNFGIDFTGGLAWEVTADEPSVGDTRDALRPLGLDGAKIQVLGRNVIRVQADPEVAEGDDEEEVKDDVAAALAEVAGTDASEVSVNEVGPSWGDEITKKARNALIAFLIAVSIFISLRFEPKMAMAALTALVHDILVTVGVYSLSGFEVTPATVVAFLTILGYSLYDTIVVFDKVQENTRGLAATGRMSYGDMVNLSMNQVLMRSLNTSLVSIMPIFSILVVGALILGATTLQDFGLALLVGLLTGAYSSLYIASPILAVLKGREPRYAAIRQRLESRGQAGLITPAAAASRAAGRDPLGAPVDSGDGAAARPRPAARPVQPAPRPGGQPRPRKKGRRR